MEPMAETPFNILPSPQPDRSRIMVFTSYLDTFIPVFKFHLPPLNPWFICICLHSQSLNILLVWGKQGVTYNLAASTDFAADTAANRAAAPYVARAADADIASSAATLGESRLFDVGGCGKGSSNKSKEDGGGLHFDGVEGLKNWGGRFSCMVSY